MNAETYQKAANWLSGNDTGLSSKTIMGAFLGTQVDSPDMPWDADDFGRCYRLLKLFPEWRNKLHVVSEKYPAFTPAERVWDLVETLYETGDYHLCHKVLQESRKKWIDESNSPAKPTLEIRLEIPS